MTLYELKIHGRFVQIICDSHNRKKNDVLLELIEDGYPIDIQLVYYKHI